MSKTRAWEYDVQGSGRFPLDMLRYDRCTPLHEADTSIILMLTVNDRIITLLSSLRPPTIGRWHSFGWNVIAIREVK